MSRIITVFGATGAQGGSVVDSILAHPELKTYKIRGVTRDTTKAAAKALETKGVQLVQADLNDITSIQEAIRDSYAVFAVTNYWETMSKDTEVQQGKNVADASVKEKVHHLVWSSLPHVTTLTDGALKNVEHFDAKAEVEEYIRKIPQSQLPVASFFLPAFYMSNVKGMTFPGEHGKTFAQPWNAQETRVALLDTKKDTGNFVAGMLASPDAEVHGKRVHGVSQWRSPQQIVDTITEVTGEKVNFVQTTQEQTVQAMGGNKMAIELAENMVLIRDYSYYGKDSEKDSAKSNAFLVDEPVSWAAFVKANW